MLKNTLQSTIYWSQFVELLVRVRVMVMAFQHDDRNKFECGALQQSMYLEVR